jgi:hypothetical protein
MANGVVVRRAWPRQCRRASRTPEPCSGSGSGSSAQPDHYTMGHSSRKQCCGSGSASFWLPGSSSGSTSASNKNPDPHMDPHHRDMLYPEPDPHQFTDDKPKCMEYEPILALFQGFDPLFGS